MTSAVYDAAFTDVIISIAKYNDNILIHNFVKHIALTIFSKIKNRQDPQNLWALNSRGQLLEDSFIFNFKLQYSCPYQSAMFKPY